MQGDFSRVHYEASKHFAAVLAQQGRVSLDSDQNENTLILLHYLRTVVADLVGPCARPAGSNAGFAVTTTTTAAGDPDLALSRGRMYVGGLLVENDLPELTYWTQPQAYLDPDLAADALAQAPYLVYLRVWERLVTALQDDQVREVALGDLAPDTSARRQVVWQVATASADVPADGSAATADGLGWLAQNLGRQPLDVPLLRAQAIRPAASDDHPCDLSPDARYRGPENQLYRVEIHRGGVAYDPGAPAGQLDQAGGQGNVGAGAGVGVGVATFSFSRENASVVFAIDSVAGASVTLADLGRDRKLALDVGDWVELLDDRYSLRLPVDPPLPLHRVVAIDYPGRTVTLDQEPVSLDASALPGTEPQLHPFLRRWDHPRTTTTDSVGEITVSDDGALPVVEGHWIDLEDGVQVMFVAGTQKDQRLYRRGDYWWIPARTIPGDVLWPRDELGPVSRPPDGVSYHYAPLAWVAADGTVTPAGDEIPTPNPDLTPAEFSNAAFRDAAIGATAAPRPAAPAKAGPAQGRARRSPARKQPR
ncbi:DUF6519 domain-containing protein [Jatrophihabitans telluris]|uniref:DUF6519 domain-containing protein n=1 Tax=Jatrophihabitans telluris TaxID=2038343 RepID=A0ABY4QX68_9ACTN|nr:DUF6519 domain-containing protein [Jatrophihabitans telluris]UQX88120.1 DUF6519 domain-containing protein [Jatrophihabitans telluris]